MQINPCVLFATLFCLAAKAQEYVGLFDNGTSEIVKFANLSTAPFVSRNDPIVASSDSWALDRINQIYGRDGFVDKSFGAPGVSVFVFDTGVDFSHPEFSGVTVLKGADFYPEDPFSPSCDIHGTAVASTITGKSVGVLNNKTKIGSVRVMDCSGVGSVFRVLIGVNWLLRKNPRKPTIVVMAFQTAELNVALNAGINRLAKHPFIIVVTAAGNSDPESNQNACNVSPASVTRSIAVGATDMVDERRETSNYGKCVDFYLPGSSVQTAGYNGGYKLSSGTSFATGFAAGIIANKWNNKRRLRSGAMRGLLQKTRTYTVPSCGDGTFLPTLSLTAGTPAVINYSAEPLGLWGESVTPREFKVRCLEPYCVFLFSSRPNDLNNCGNSPFRVSIRVNDIAKVNFAVMETLYMNFSVSNGGGNSVSFLRRPVLANETDSVQIPLEDDLFFTSSTNMFSIYSL
jgi:subtilisin family serine protease